jgi:riboflavin synthase
MFTGIIEGLGHLEEIRRHGQAMQLAVRADFDLAGTRIGDSIAVNGACLTVITLEQNRFVADVSAETLSKTTFGSARRGEAVNLERALRLSDRLDGHLVSGHVDGTARLIERKSAANAILLTFSAPESLTRYMIEKGSVAIHGISLTINHCDVETFQVSIIPHTAAITTVGQWREGDAVNIETDLIGKYVARFLDRKPENVKKIEKGVSLELLAKSGFME